MRCALSPLLFVAACASVPVPVHPVAPASLPAGALVPYEQAGRSFSAPPGGTLDGEYVRYPSHAVVYFGSTWSRGDELTDERVWSFLRFDLGALAHEAVRMREHRAGMTLLCLQGDDIARDAPRTRAAACARVLDDDVRRGEGVVVIAVFRASPTEYERLGGARVAAEAARSARGFEPPGE
jgi:hypothetical protein